MNRGPRRPGASCLLIRRPSCRPGHAPTSRNGRLSNRCPFRPRPGARCYSRGDERKPSLSSPSSSRRCSRYTACSRPGDAFVLPLAPSPCPPASTCEQHGANKVHTVPLFFVHLKYDRRSYVFFQTLPGYPSPKAGVTNPAKLQPPGTQMWSFASAMYTAQVRLCSYASALPHILISPSLCHIGRETPRSTAASRPPAQMFSRSAA